MRFLKLFSIAAFVLLALSLIMIGCGGQQSSQESAAPPSQPAQTAPQTTPSAITPETPSQQQAVETTKAPEEKPAPRVKERASQPSAPAQPATAAEMKPSEPAAAATTQQPPAAQPATPPPPAPQVVEITVPQGTVLDVAFLDPLSSKANKVGDTFRAQVKKDIIQDAIVVIPMGSIVKGTVTEAVPLKGIGGQAKLSLEFSTLEVQGGQDVPIRASFAEKGKSETGKDAATIGGAAAGGALLGRILGKHDKGKATVIGALLGAAAGTVIAAETKGQEISIPAGTEISLQLVDPVKVNVTY